MHTQHVFPTLYDWKDMPSKRKYKASKKIHFRRILIAGVAS